MADPSTRPVGRPSDGSGEAPWPASWLRGLLGLTILAVLHRGDNHGYAVTQALQDRGFGRVTGGGLYPVLGRLEEAGLISARWAEGDGGPGRKVYTLTDAGRAALREQTSAWAGFRTAVDTLLERDLPGSGLSERDLPDRDEEVPTE